MRDVNDGTLASEVVYSVKDLPARDGIERGRWLIEDPVYYSLSAHLHPFKGRRLTSGRRPA